MHAGIIEDAGAKVGVRLLLSSVVELLIGGPGVALMKPDGDVVVGHAARPNSVIGIPISGVGKGVKPIT
jgi:hypothetical protein